MKLPYNRALFVFVFVFVFEAPLRSVNIEMSFWCPQFLPKNERKQVNLRFNSSKVKFIRPFFGLKKSF